MCLVMRKKKKIIPNQLYHESAISMLMLLSMVITKWVTIIFF